MKNRNLMFLVGLLTGILATILIAILVVPKVLFIESESKYDFATSKQMIENGASENNWAMPHQYDLQMTMQKHGFEVSPVTVFSVCQPKLAHQVLGSNHERIVSAMMPCRIALYQKADGKTYVSRMNADLMSKLFGKKVKKVMSQAGAGSEQILEPIIIQ